MLSQSVKFTLMVCFIPLISFIGGTIYTAAFPELSLVFDVSSTLIKFSLTIYFIGMIVGTILSGVLSDLYGRLYILTFFLMLFCLSSLFCGFALSFHWFLVGRFFQGIASAAGPITIISLVADRFEGADYKKYVSYVLIMLGIAPGLAPILGSFILHVFDWRGIFYFLTACGLLGLGLVLSVGIEKKQSRPKLTEALVEYISFIKNPFFRQYCLIIGVLYGAFNSILIVSPYIFRLHYNWTIVEFAWVGLGLAIGDSLGAFLNDILVEKNGSQRIVLSGLAVGAMAFVLLLSMGLPQNGIWFLVIASFFVVGANLTAACLTANAVKMNPQFTGISSSLVYLAKFMLCSVVLVLVLLLPNDLLTINLFIFASLFISFLAYLNIRTTLSI